MKAQCPKMGCGQSKSARKTHANDGYDPGSDTEVYVKAPAIAVEKAKPVADDSLAVGEGQCHSRPENFDPGSKRLSNGETRPRIAEQNEHVVVKHHLVTTNLNTTTKISDSQLEFFRMLDDKVEGGRDYVSESEASEIIGS